MKIKSNEQVEMTLNVGDDAKALVESIFETYPSSVKTAAVACSLTSGSVSGERIIELVKVMMELNPFYPTDSVNMRSMINFLCNEDSIYPSDEEVSAWKGLLPDSLRNQRCRMEFFSENQYFLLFSGTIGKDGPYAEYRVSPSASGGYPYSLIAKVYTDMDDLDNHYDGCPLLLEDEEFYEDEDEDEDVNEDENSSEEFLADFSGDFSTDCNCESQVEYFHTFYITDFEEQKEKLAQQMAYVLLNRSLVNSRL